MICYKNRENKWIDGVNLLITIHLRYKTCEDIKFQSKLFEVICAEILLQNGDRLLVASICTTENVFVEKYGKLVCKFK